MTASFVMVQIPCLPASVVAGIGFRVVTLFGRAAGPILIATLWQGLALAALAALGLRLLPRMAAALRFAFWAAALLVVCLLHLAGAAPAPRAAINLDPRWSIALAALWLTLSLVRGVDLIRNALRLGSLGRQATPVAADPALAALLRTHRQAQLCTSTLLDRPGVIGFFHPRILIPAWLFDQLTTPELEQIVLHELEHLRRRDDWLNLFQKLALVVFPLNPALHWIERRLCLERELACDEGVVRRTRAPHLYATCLARLAEYGLDHRALSLALGFLERQSELARRVSGILHAPRTLTPRKSVILTGTVAILLLGGSAELSRCPQFVSFAASPVALATNSGAPRLAPETWVPTHSPTSVLYTDAATPRLLRAALGQAHKPVRKTKTHRTHMVASVQRASAKQIAAPVDLVATDFIQPANIPAPVTPTLVRYTLVHVEGGWLLLQL